MMLLASSPSTPARTRQVQTSPTRVQPIFSPQPRAEVFSASTTAAYLVGTIAAGTFLRSWNHNALDRRARPRQVVRAVKDVEKKRKLISPQRRIERLFVEEFKKSFFSPNPWYESPELTFPGGNPQKIYNYWMTTRPTRDIERVCDGKDSCGCTWTQLDGRRGASFVSFNQEGQVVFVREVCEPQGLGAKFKDNTLKSLQQVTGVMNAIQGMFSALDRILVQEDPEDGPKPVNGLEAPRSGRAKDVARYLWEEAQWDPVDPVEKIMSQFSEDAVYEDLTREDSSFVGWEAIKRYQEETKENTPDNMRFVLDEMTDGEKACTVIWHVEFNTRLSPRGVTTS